MIKAVLKYLKHDGLMQPIMNIFGRYFKLSSRMITCREINDSTFDYINGDLTEEQVTLFQRHIRICPICRTFLKTYVAVHEAESHVIPFENIDVPDTMPQGLIHAILNVRKNKDR